MLKKISFVLIYATIFASSNGDINVTNSCNDLTITKIEYSKHKRYRGGEEYGVSYGLKNRSKNTIKYKVIIYPKDNEGNRIGESRIGSGTLKAHYEEPFNDGSYYAVGENMSTFSGNADLNISCEKEKQRTISKNKTFGTIRLKKSAFKMFEDKSDFEASMMASIILKAVDAKGGMENFMDIVKPCLLKDKKK